MKMYFTVNSNVLNSCLCVAYSCSCLCSSCNSLIAIGLLIFLKEKVCIRTCINWKLYANSRSLTVNSKSTLLPPAVKTHIQLKTSHTVHSSSCFYPHLYGPS